MRKWVYKLFSIVLCALVIGASADVAFALPKKLPKLKGGKRPRITVPKTPSTRNLPPTSVARPNVATQVERATAVQAAKAVTTPSVAPTHALQETLITPAVQDTGTNLTGTQVLQTYFPTWREELGGMFSKEQLDAVEKAFAATDDWIFVQGEDGELTIRNKDEWNYETRFLTILTRDSGVTFTDKQIKQLIGGRGSNGFIFTFRLYFLRMNATGFSCAKEGKKPRAQISRDGKSLSSAEMTLEEEQERRIGLGLTRSRNHPLVEAYMQQKNRPISESKTPEEYVMLARQYPSKPRAHIYRNGRALSREEMTPEEVQEVNIGMGLSRYPNHPLVRAYLQENRRIAEAKTAEEYLELARQYPTKPRTRIYRNGRILSEEEMTEEEIEETIIGKGLYNHSNHPLVQAYLQENRQLAESKTAEEYVKLARQYPSKPRAEIWKNRHKLSREEMTPGEVQEVNIGNGLNYHRNHPLVRAYMQENRLYAESKTPEEYVMLARQYPSKPRAHIYRNGRALSREEMTPEEVQEVNIGMGLSRYPNHPLVRAYMQENRIKAVSQTTQQLYVTLVDYIKNHSHYPIVRGNSLYTNIYNRLYYYQSTLVDGKYADPYLQKIYEIKLWSERVKRGEVDWEQFPGLFKKRRPRIGEKRRAQIDLQKQQQLQKEFEALPADEQEAIEQMADNLLTLWEDFEGVWWQQNRQHIMMTPQTQLAFNTVLNTVRHQMPSATNVNISNVLEQVNGMQLGQDGPEYYSVIYRGDNPRLPRAEDFHNVWESQGIPQANAQAAYKLNSPHIDLDGDKEMVYNLLVRQGVTDKEMAAVIDALTPAGWEIRLGAHELLKDIKQGKIHIHIEQVVPTTEEDAQDISNVLRVDLRALTQGKNPQQVAKTLRYLFAKYLQDDGHQALNNIQKAF